MRFLFLFFSLLLLAPSLQGQYYFPDRGAEWETQPTERFGLDAEKIQDVVAFALANEYSESRDLRVAILKGFAREPYHKLLGLTKKRGGPAGMILKNGYRIASWGDTKRVDMTFSVTKSYLSTVAGLALAQGLIQNLNDPVKKYVWDATFDGEHNSAINWTHLLQQTSDWSGSLWDSYDWADRPPREGGVDDWKNRKLHAPGTHYKYNDVRVNVLAYSLLQVLRKPLPAVLKEHIMDPIGASSTWRWFGYENSWVNVDGQWMQSVSGGGHSGGGVFISTEDHARFGLLFLAQGKWKEQQLFPKNWVDKVVQPAVANPNYGMMWWLNNPKGSNYIPEISDKMYYAAGFGGNFIFVFPEEDMVVVTRWLEPRQRAAFLKKLAAALN